MQSAGIWIGAGSAVLICLGLIGSILFLLGLGWVHLALKTRREYQEKEAFVKELRNKGLLILAFVALVSIGPCAAAPDDNSGQVIALADDHTFFVQVEQSEDLGEAPSGEIVLVILGAGDLQAGEWIYFDIIGELGQNWEMPSYLTKIYKQIGQAPALVGAQVGV